MRRFKPWFVFRVLLGLGFFALLWGACPAPPTGSEPTAPDAAGKEPIPEPTAAEPTPERPSSPEPTKEPSPEKVAEKVAEKDDPKPYTLTLFDREVIHSTGKVNVRNVSTKFKLKHASFAKVRLLVKLESPCYPFENWGTRPPGHNWPENCDAFDRNMDVTWRTSTADNAPPGFDLERIITPFGGPLETQVDLTDLANGISKKFPPGHEHDMKVHISTYSDGSGKVSGSKGRWFVTVKLEITPGKAPRNVLAVYSLFNHSYKHNDGKKESVEFSIPDDTNRARLEYRVTGHGGGPADSKCIGHADEFCRRSHRLFADDKQFLLLIPWRTDCAKFCTLTKHPFSNRNYCKENPCGAERSVKASRANWCPGAITPPFTKDVDAFLTPGKHSLAYSISNVAQKGSWRVSATLYAYGP